MSDTLTGATGRNYVAGEWRDADTGDTYEKRSPWRPSEVTGVYQASGTADVDAAVAAARDAFPRVGGAARSLARRDLPSGGRRRRRPHGADRRRHDGRDGEAPT